MRNLLAKHLVNSPNDTNNVGHDIFNLVRWPACVYLQGDLGAGKTTLCQAIIKAAGYQGAVTSPTYNLIQEYPVSVALAERARSVDKVMPEHADHQAEAGAESVGDGALATIYHMDLYRLNDPQELFYLGISELWQPSSLFLIEWPEKGKGVLQEPDYIVEMSKNNADTEESRIIKIYQTF